VAQKTPHPVLERLCDALNRHDIETLLTCFHSDYQSQQPAHPGRAYSGIATVRKNWLWVFETFPDYQADLLRSSFDDGVLWTEWHWHGTHVDDLAPIDVRGVALFGLEDGVISWARLYLEPVR
jgi:hypothetical protein